MSPEQEFPPALLLCLKHSLALKKYTLGVEQRGPREIKQFTDAHGACKGAELGTAPRLLVPRTQTLQYDAILH